MPGGMGANKTGKGYRGALIENRDLTSSQEDS